MRHAGFLYNRFAVNPRGSTSHELLYGRSYRGQLVPLGEQVLFYKPTKHRGDLQWCRGVWLGLHERNGAHLLGTADGVFESRSIRRLPEESQWSAEAVLGMRGLPWSYLGKGKRKRPLYTGAAGARIPCVPDAATLEELAKAAGKAAADALSAAGTPTLPQQAGQDEAGTDPSSPSSSLSTSSTSTGAKRGPQQAQEPAGPPQESHDRLQAQGLERGPQQAQEPTRAPQESHDRLQAQGLERGSQQAQELTRPPQESHDRLQAHRATSVGMDVTESSGLSREVPEGRGENPKRPRLLLDRPRGSGRNLSASPSSASGLYPPGYAGVNEVHGDIPNDELAGPGRVG